MKLAYVLTLLQWLEDFIRWNGQGFERGFQMYLRGSFLNASCSSARVCNNLMKVSGYDERRAVWTSVNGASVFMPCCFGLRPELPEPALIVIVC